MAVGVYKEVNPGVTVTLATGTRTSTSNFIVQISSNSSFYGYTTTGINVRGYRGTSRYSNAITFYSSDVPDYVQRDYLYSNTGTITAKSNLTSGAAYKVTFSGNIYF